MAASAGPVRAESQQDPDRTCQAGAVSLLSATKRILEMIAAGGSLTDILTTLCAAIDDHNPDMMSIVMLMDPDGQRMWPAAAPRMPPEFVKAISPLMVGENMASCGTAAFRKERVILPDVATDPLMSALPAGMREMVLAQGIQGQWSQPLLSKDNEVLGTFGLFHGTPRSPTASELQLIEDVANIAVIAIEGERSQAALKKALQTVETSEQRLRTILDTIPTQAWCLRPDGTVEYISQRFHDYTGISRVDAPVAAHPDDALRVAKRRQEIFSAPHPGEFEVRLRRYDGQYRWFLVRVEPLRDERGNVILWYGTNTDIEDLKQAEVKLRQDQQELRGIVDAIPQLIVVREPDGTFLYANRALLEYSGLTVDQLMAPDLRARFVHPEDLGRVHDERRQGLSGSVPFEIEHRLRHKDGQYRWFVVRYHPLLDDQGLIVRWYASGTDIDDRKRAEQRMRNENLALREDIDRPRCSRRSSAPPRPYSGCWPRRRRWLKPIPRCSSSGRPVPGRSWSHGRFTGGPAARPGPSSG
jgi:PAS domain S-box-containing protein